MSEKYSYIQNFSTEILKNMLREMTLSDADLDMELMDCILNELNSREGAPETMAPEDALKIFEEEYSGNESAFLDCAYEEKETQTPPAETKPNRRKHSLSRVFFVAATVAVLTLGTLIAVQASGTDVFGALATWTNEIFGFGPLDKALSQSEKEEFVWPENDIPREIEFHSLQEALDAYGINTEIAEPKWMPDGFSLNELSCYYDPEEPRLNFYSAYTNAQGAQISVAFTSYSGVPATVYEKTDAPVEEYTIGNNTFFVFSNERTEKVVWATEHFECTIFGHITREEVKAIAESIYH